jgi:hypothetical protein
MIRLLICGSRDWKDYWPIYLELAKRSHEIEVVIEGECRGADRMAAQAARELAIPVLEFPADWNKHGKAAGIIRNREMLDVGKPDEVWAFHEYIDASRGTKHMVELARKNGVPVKLFDRRSEKMKGGV